MRDLATTSTPTRSFASVVVNRPAVSTSTVSCQTEFYWVTTTAPTTTPPARILPVSKPSYVSCSTNTDSPTESTTPAVSEPSVSTVSSIVAAPTQQQSDDSAIYSLMNELSSLDNSHIMVSQTPTWQSSKMPATMDPLVQKTARDRSKSPDVNMPGDRKSGRSPSGGRPPTSSPDKKKHRTSSKDRKPR